MFVYTKETKARQKYSRNEHLDNILQNGYNRIIKSTLPQILSCESKTLMERYGKVLRISEISRQGRKRMGKSTKLWKVKTWGGG
jgi:hypothetical protein